MTSVKCAVVQYNQRLKRTDITENSFLKITKKTGLLLKNSAATKMIQKYINNTK